jgi:hypothetical protein
MLRVDGGGSSETILLPVENIFTVIISVLSTIMRVKDIIDAGKDDGTHSCRPDGDFVDYVPVRRFTFGKYERRVGLAKSLFKIFVLGALVVGGTWWAVESIRSLHFFKP